MPTPLVASANPFATPVMPVTDGLRVLCVDDNPVCRRLVEIVLTRDGHTVTSATDGQDALEQFRRAAGDFDVVITDHNMPRMDGLAFVRALRATGFAGGIAVISAGLDAAMSHCYRALRVGPILAKPVRVEQIRAAVERLRPR